MRWNKPKGGYPQKKVLEKILWSIVSGISMGREGLVSPDIRRVIDYFLGDNEGIIVIWSKTSYFTYISTRKKPALLSL